MANEIELKLSVSRHHIESLRQQPLLQSAEVTDQGAKALKNIYFDTPDKDLTAARVALRIREKDGRFIQTLKTAGTAEGGLHQRKEWEWYLDAPELDFSLLGQAEWPEHLQDESLLSQIKPVFATDFMRHCWLYDGFNAAGERVLVEIALDQGQAWLGKDDDRRFDDICELELELMAGEPYDLYMLALALGQQVPLLSSDISKAQRGYRLASPEAYQVRVPELTFTEEATLEDAFCQLVQHELNLWPQYLEAWQFTRDWRYVTCALESLRNISAHYESFSDIIPAAPDGELDQLLTKLIRQLRDVDAWQRSASLMGSNGGDWQSAAQTRAESRMEVLLQTVGLGQIALRIGRQLVARLWRQRWTDEHRDKALQRLQQP